MKNIYLLIIALFLSASIVAQEDEDMLFEQDDFEQSYKPENNKDEIKTLFASNTHGGYGGVFVMYTPINGIDGMSIGGRGGWIIGHGLAIGFGGCGYFSNMQYDTNNIKYNLAGGHGGMYLEPILLPKFPVHLSFPIFIGAGGLSYLEYENNEDPFEEEVYPTESDSYFIAEPGVELEFNMLRNFRLTLGVYYTYTTELKMEKIEQRYPLKGLKYGLTFKFGSF